MGFWAWAASHIFQYLPEAEQQRITSIRRVRNYAAGVHKPQLTRKVGQADDNVTLNFIGVICQRSVSALFGNGFDLDWKDAGESEQAAYVTQVLKANHEEILFHRAGLVGAETGTICLKIVPTATLPRLVLLNPEWVTIETRPDDFETVTRYTIQYTIGEAAYKQTIEPDESGTAWIIRDWEYSAGTRNQWQMKQETTWPYDFPPILSWQNLPATNDVYGLPDITDDVIALQDRVNFVAGNISKIIRYHAHPKTWASGIIAGKTPEKASWGADEMITAPAGATIQNLEMQSDLASSQQYLLTLRQAMFDITRTVDLDSIADKVGSLTNFGLRVLYQDFLQKIETKRELYGDAIEELARRLQILAGYEPLEATVVWPEILPINKAETMQAVEKSIALGILSKETGAVEMGFDWEKERERLENEAALGDNIGAQLLRAFNRGQA